MNDISGFGIKVNVVASKTFPTGFMVTQFADDADPLDIPSMQIADGALGLNGDAVKWSMGNLIPLTLNIIPNSADDRNLAILAEANRVARNKKSANDVITMTISYPDGRTCTLLGGYLSDAPFANSVASAGRLKTKAYAFKFENKVEA